MKQLIQSVSTGELAVLDVPTPKTPRAGILVRTHASVVSAGTERTIVSFAEKNLLQKARSRPDLVRQTIDKARRDGILDTLDAVRNRLEQPMALGYSAAGVVLEVGPDAGAFRPGDRVACAGGSFAVHAQVLAMPRNLAVKLPDAVSFEEGAFCTIGAIALHGIRLANVQIGDVVAVIGLGLLGQLIVQILRANGCVVIGTDLQRDRVELARKFDARWTGTDVEEFAVQVAAATGGHGADAVLIAADTPSHQPVELAGDVARSRGTVISLGVVGTLVPRKVYFEKELDFRISRSYGPGRYDDAYEKYGHDYPYDFVRWTENRNLQAFAELIVDKHVQVEPLISHRFDIEDSVRAYDLVLGRERAPFMGVLLRYGSQPDLGRRIDIAPAPVEPLQSASVRAGVLGAGMFANAILLPAMKKTAGVKLAGIASGGGVSARAAASRFGFEFCSTDAEEVLRDPRVNTVAILTRHNLHARQTIDALEADKHVFVEKPLCLTEDELEQITAAHGAHSSSMLMVGFNRRFAPFVVALRESFDGVSDPMLLTCRVNAGFIPTTHWLHDPEQGGGRLRAEGCHFIDLLIHLARQRVRAVTTRVLPDAGRYRQDNFTVTLEMENGSIGNLVYLANGARSFGKESIEAFGGGIAARLDDYRSLAVEGGPRPRRLASRLRQDKGHRAEWEAIARHITAGGPPPIPVGEIFHSARVTLAAWESLNSARTVVIE